MTDKLRMDHINSLPQPFTAHFGGSEWPVFDIDVGTGLLRIDVCGLLELKHIGEVVFFLCGHKWHARYRKNKLAMFFCSQCGRKHPRGAAAKLENK